MKLSTKLVLVLSLISILIITVLVFTKTIDASWWVATIPIVYKLIDRLYNDGNIRARFIWAIVFGFGYRQSKLIVLLPFIEIWIKPIGIE